MASLPESPNLAIAMAAAAAAGHRPPGVDYYANMMSKIWSAGILSPPHGGDFHHPPHILPPPHLSLESLRFPPSDKTPSPVAMLSPDKIHTGLNNNSILSSNKNQVLPKKMIGHQPQIQQPPSLPLPLNNNSIPNGSSSGRGGKTSQITCNCGTTFPNLEILERHMMTHHPENTNLLCSICQKQFPNFTKLQRHMTNHNNSPDLRKFKCNRCGKAFKFKHHLKEHERIHTGEKPFECKHCGKRFSHSGSYSSHTTSKKCLQLGRRPNQPVAGGQPVPTSQPLFGGSSPTKSTINGGGSWSPRPPFHQPKGPREPSSMPLSPPLTPLPTARFPPPGVLLPGPYPAPGHQPPHLQNFLLAAAQYGPFLGQGPRLDFVENLQRFIQMRSSLADSKPSEEEEEEDDAKKFPEPKGSEEIQISGEDKFLKREEELVEDEMKVEEEQEDDDGLMEDDVREDSRKLSEDVNNALKHQLLEQARIVMMKKFLENENSESKRTEGSLSEDELDSLSKKFKVDDLSRSLHETCDSLYDDQESQDGLNQGSSSDERKVRVRTLISEEQLSVLKTHYSLNPRPKREELEKIAAEIGHPFKVVKVWFQNSRARDRREGKPLSVLSGGGSESPQLMAGLLSYVSAKLQTNGSNNNNGDTRKCDSKTPDSTFSDKSHPFEEQPLDLSNKGSSPSASPASSQTKEDVLSSSSNPMPLFPILPSNLPSLQEFMKSRGEQEEDERNSLEGGPNPCPKCNKTFSKQTALAKHCSLEHSDSRPYACDFCEKAFKHKHHLSEHKRLHTGEKPFQCSQCLKRFSHSGSYSQHINHRYKSCKPGGVPASPSSTSSQALLEDPVGGGGEHPSSSSSSSLLFPLEEECN